MSSEFVDRFASVSADYAAFRPVYPEALFDWLASVAPARDLAWDCATGSGQAAVALAHRFSAVIASDASESQIAHAQPHERIEYRVGAAEESGIPSSTVDLITVAQAIHWFDIENFFAECDRVLVPEGVLAVWSYGPLHISSPVVDRIVQGYYYDIVGPYWPEQRALVDSGYAGIRLPYAELEVPAFHMSESWTMDRLRGYISTWSATLNYREQAGSDPLALIEQALHDAWNDPDAELEVVFPLTVRVAKKREG